MLDCRPRIPILDNEKLESDRQAAKLQSTASQVVADGLRDAKLAKEQQEAALKNMQKELEKYSTITTSPYNNTNRQTTWVYPQYPMPYRRGCCCCRCCRCRHYPDYPTYYGTYC